MQLTSLLQAPLSTLHTLRETRLCLNYIGVEEGDLVCEIGCGNGFTSFILSKLVKQVTAVDISEQLIKYLNEQSHPHNVRFQVIDVTKPLPKEFWGRYDKAICIDVMEHVEDPKKALDFTSQILKKGGIAIVTFPLNMPHHGKTLFAKSDLEKLAQECEACVAEAKILKLSRVGSIIDHSYTKFRELLRPSKEVNTFENTVAFEMMRKPRRIYGLFKLLTVFLFTTCKDPFYEDESGERALLILRRKE